MCKIVIIEDDADICNMIKKFLENNKYSVQYALNGLEGINLCKSFVPDLIILDIMLPRLNGDDVLQKLRKFTNAPVIVVSAKTMVQTKIELLKMGADDYMIKPFDSKELVARVKAVLRRYKPAAAAPEAADIRCVEYPDLTVNLSNYSVMYNGHPIDMPPKELELLYFLAASPNQVFTREQLLDHIWGYEYIGDTRTVDVHIKRIREKIHDHESWSIGTVWGIGYKFETSKKRK